MEIQRGMRDKIGKYVSIDQKFEVCMHVDGKDEYDYSCFGVDDKEKLSDDRYMIFYNQEKSPKGEITYSSDGSIARFLVNLSELPTSINKLVFTTSVDGSGTMGSIQAYTVTIHQNNQTLISLKLNGTDFKTEKAIISIELYRKQGEWRFHAVARGFNGGLGDLLRFFGGEEVSSEPQPAAAQNPIQTNSKPIQKTEKVSLKKGQKVSLTKNVNNDPIIVENGWTAVGKDYDLKALVRYRDGTLMYIGAANQDERLSTPEGAVRHGGDVTEPGELEHIYIKWHPDIASVAVSSYSALENGHGSFHRYGVYVRIRNGNQTVEIPASDVSANDYSYTLCFGEILFGQEKDSLEVVALEMYSAPKSEHRIGYRNGRVVMDIGPMGATKS